MKQQSPEDGTEQNDLDFDLRTKRQQLFEVDYEGLSIHDIELLLDERNLEDGSLDNARTRIRDRLCKVMLSFIAVKWGLSDRDYELLAKRIKESRTIGRETRTSESKMDYLGNSLYTGLVGMVAFALKLARTAGINEEILIEEAIPWSDISVFDAEVDIKKYTPQRFEIESIKTKIENGDEVRLDEIGWLAVQDELSQNLIEKIQDKDQVIAFLSSPDDPDG